MCGESAPDSEVTGDIGRTLAHGSKLDLESGNCLLYTLIVHDRLLRVQPLLQIWRNMGGTLGNVRRRRLLNRGHLLLYERGSLVNAGLDDVGVEQLGALGHELLGVHLQVRGSNIAHFIDLRADARAGGPAGEALDFFWPKNLRKQRASA